MDCTPGQTYLRIRRSVAYTDRSIRRALLSAGLGLALLVWSDPAAAIAQDEPPASDSPPAIDYIVLDHGAETADSKAYGPDGSRPSSDPAQPGTSTDVQTDARSDLPSEPAAGEDAKVPAPHAAESGSPAADESGVHSAAGDHAASPATSEPARAADHGREDAIHQIELGVPALETAGSGGARSSVEKSVAPAAWELLDPPYSHPSRLPVSGKAMYYNPGVMDIVIDSRLKFDHIEPCAHCIGYVAMLRFGDLNRTVWLQIDESRVEGPFHVVDAAATKHVGMLLDRDWIVDVDYKTAARWNFRMPYVTVWDRPPSELLLATDTLPLAWNASLLPAPAFKPLPKSISLPDSALENQALRVKKAIDKRLKGRVSFVDVLEAPDEIYVK